MHLAVVSPVYCHPDWRGSGVGRASMDLTLALAARGHTIELVCPLADAEHRFDEPPSRRLADDRIHLHPVPQAYSSRFGTSGHGVAAVLGPILEKVDVLHIHGFFSGITDVAARRARAAGVPYVIQPHGKLAPAFMANRPLQKKLYLMWRGLAHLRDAAAVIPLTREIADLIEALDPLIRTAVCPNGLDPVEFEGSTPPSPLDAPYLLFFGWLDPRKNVDLLIRAFARAGGAVDGWKLALVGPDGYGREGMLRKVVERHGLGDRVVFPGMVRDEAKVAWLKNAGLFVLPSKGEGLSVAMLEVLACSIPCLLSPGCNYGEIEEGGAGQVVELTDDAWAAAMIDWTGDEARRAAASAGARRLFEEHHTLSAVGVRLESILRDASSRASRDARCGRVSGFDSTRVLVTGGAGFIGSHLVDGLLAAGARVVVIDDFSTGSRANLEGRDVELHEASILDQEALEPAIAGCRCVFHEAAMVSVPQSIAEPLRCHDVNVTGTLRTLLAARDAGVDRVVLASSCAVYGLAPSLPSRETDPVDAVSPYAASKAATELLAMSVARAYGLSTVCLRYFNVFGPRQDPSSPYAAVVAAFVRCALEGTSPRVDGDGRQTRDFVPVASIVDANLRAARAEADLRGEVFNVGTGVRTSLLDLLETVGRLTGKTIEPVHAAARVGDVRDSVADVTRAREVLGYEPAEQLEDALRAMVG